MTSSSRLHGCTECVPILVSEGKPFILKCMDIWADRQSVVHPHPGVSKFGLRVRMKRQEPSLHDLDYLGTQKHSKVVK